MLIPTDIIGVEQALPSGCFLVRDPQTNSIWPKAYTDFQEAVAARGKAEKAAANLHVESPVSVLHISTTRQIAELASEVGAYSELLTHPMLNAPEVRA